MKSSELVNYRKLDLKELQSLQISVMKQIHDMCIAHKIKYYIIGGTLLGAVRHNGFIPWDDDIDIAMLRDDYENFAKLFYSNFKESDYFLQSYSTDVDFRPAMLRVCIKGTIHDVPSERHLKSCKNTYIDVFPLDNVPDSKIAQLLQFLLLRIVDRMITAKLYNIYEKNSRLKVMAKITLAYILKVVPLTALQNARVSIMKWFNKVPTKNVCSTVSRYGYCKQILNRSIYGEPRLYQFEDTEFYGVERADCYLTHIYGRDYMNMPKKEARPSPCNVYVLNSSSSFS